MIKSIIVDILNVTTDSMKAIKNVYRLIKQYIYIVVGLYYDFSCAWKSGKNPSPINEIIKNKFPSDKNLIG